MRKFIPIFALLSITLPLLATTYTIGPGKTYTNIGDAPWSTLAAGDIVQIYPKTYVTAVVSSTSTAISYTGTLTSGSCTVASVTGSVTPWIGQAVTGTGIPALSAITTVGSGTFTFANTNGSCASASGSITITGDGETVTLTTSAGSIPYGSDVRWSGETVCTAALGLAGTACVEPSITTCGIQGSGLYSTATGGTACSGDVLTLREATAIPNGTTLWITAPYFEKFIDTAAGTSGSPIVIEGMADPTTGAYPALDPDFATTGPNMAHSGSTAYHDAYGCNFLPWNSAGTAHTAYTTIENLRVQDCQTGITMYDGTNTAYSTASGYGLRMDDATNLTLHNMEFLFNGNGLFGADNPGLSPTDVLGSMTVENTHFYRNGSGYGAHQSYVESHGSTYQYDWYDSPTYTASNSQLKDRSSGTVIRYNRFGASNGFANDLVDAQNSLYDNVPMSALNVPTGGFAANATSLTFATISLTGSTTAGSITVSVSSTAGLQTGMQLIGTGIPAGAQIAVVNGGAINLDWAHPATSTNASEALTANTVQNINVGDRVGYINSTVGWGYPGSGQPVMPAVTAVNAGTNTITLASPGIPAALAAGQVLQVINRTLNTYQQTFVYGNVYDYNQANWTGNSPPPIHCCWDTAAGIDSVADRAGTVYMYDNTTIIQSNTQNYNMGGYRLESDFDGVDAVNNFWYVGDYGGGTETYLILVEGGGYTGTGLVSTTFASGNNQVGTSPSIGPTTSCGVTWTGVQACSGTVDPNGSVTLTSVTPEGPTSLYPSGIGTYPYKLQASSTAINAASALPAAITSNTLGGNFTPVYQPDGTARANLVDLGAWQYTAGSVLATPTASPTAPYSGAATSVTLTIASGATGCYTTNGTTPAATTAGTCSTGTTYTGPISISTTTTLKAIATEAGFTNSSVFSGTYTISAGPTSLICAGVTVSGATIQ